MEVKQPVARGGKEVWEKCGPWWTNSKPWDAAGVLRGDEESLSSVPGHVN